MYNTGAYLLYFQTPIFPPSPSHTLTKSQAPITSTPTQQLAPHKSTHTPITPSDVRHSPILPSSLPTGHHHTEHPLTSTPILPSPSPNNPPYNMAAILEKEMEGEKKEGRSVKASSALHRLSESSGVGSTMERLLDFDVSICYKCMSILHVVMYMHINASHHGALSVIHTVTNDIPKHYSRELSMTNDIPKV